MTKKSGLPGLPVPAASTCSNGAIRRAARRMGQVYDDAFAPVGLKGTQYSMLSQISRLQGPTMRGLANELVMDLSALGHTLKPLERDGYVELSVDATDRRCRRVRLTENGVRKFEEAREIWNRIRSAFEDIYGVEEATQLRAKLDYVASEKFAEAMVLKLSEI